MQWIPGLLSPSPLRRPGDKATSCSTWLVDSNIYILQSGKGRGLIHETKLPMQELELKVQGGGA